MEEHKLVIQCDGDFWHSKERNKGKDIAQDTVLGFLGYKVYRFWEHEINESPQKCIDSIVEINNNLNVDFKDKIDGGVYGN